LLICPVCKSKILIPGKGHLVEKEIYLHFDKKRKDLPNQNDVGETLNLFWSVNDMFDFENIGFTNTVNGKYKYLTCADCELPILGIQFQDSDDKLNYVALERVNYQD